MSAWSWLAAQIHQIRWRQWLLGLFLALALVALSVTIAAWWQRSVEVERLLARQESLSELLTRTNDICERRLDRLERIYRTALDRSEAMIAQLEDERRQHLATMQRRQEGPAP